MKRIGLIISLIILVAMAFSQEPDGYYDAADGKTGAELKTALYNIIKGHTSVSYTPGVWNAFATTDRLPNGKMWDMYSTCDWTYSTDQCGGYTNICDCYNREHSFPKSWFNDAAPMETDIFHLYPTDGKVNGERSNYPFGEVGNTDNSVVNSDSHAKGKRGSARSGLGYSGTVFEPDDEYKGDFARTYFYMATRYENVFASWTSNSEAQPMLAGNAYPGYKTWAVNMLLEWHQNDPVSQKEIDRNNAVSAIQHNRNPFIDHPEYAVCVWKPSDCSGSSAIEDMIEDENISVYPNPATSELQITNYELRNREKIEIYDISGKLQLSTTSHNLAQFSTNAIDVSQLNSGTYFIKINDNFIKFVKK